MQFQKCDFLHIFLWVQVTFNAWLEVQLQEASQTFLNLALFPVLLAYIYQAHLESSCLSPVRGNYSSLLWLVGARKDVQYKRQ